MQTQSCGLPGYEVGGIGGETGGRGDGQDGTARGEESQGIADAFTEPEVLAVGQREGIVRVPKCGMASRREVEALLPFLRLVQARLEVDEDVVLVTVGKEQGRRGKDGCVQVTLAATAPCTLSSHGTVDAHNTLGVNEIRVDAALSEEVFGPG